MQSTQYSIVPDRLEPLELRARDIREGDLIADRTISRGLFGRKVESIKTTPRGQRIFELTGSGGLVVHETVVLTVLRPVWDIEEVAS